MVTRLHLKFKVITPLFMGGAAKVAELRPPSFKGLLRFWYRAADPKYNSAWGGVGKGKPTREEIFFGASDSNVGQAPFSIQIDSKPLKYFRWDREQVKKFDEGRGKKTRNGLVYLGYPFNMGRRKGGDEEPTAICPGHEFVVRCLLPRKEIPGLRKALLASWWLFAHLSGAGSRGRRGFGNLILEDWKSEPETWPELDALPLLHRFAAIEDFAAGLSNALGKIQDRDWFGSFPDKTPHPHLGQTMQLKFLDRQFAHSQWEAALDHMGRKLQDFRAGSPPDSTDVREYLLTRHNKTGSPSLQQTPARASFGLPLSFRFGGNVGGVTFVPFDREYGMPLERHASLLHLRLAAVGNRLYPLFVRLSGNVPGYDPSGTIQGRRFPLRPPKENAMDRFMEWLSAR